MTPKDVVIKVFGGVRATARACNLTHPAVSQWGDNVPSRHHQKLIRAAQAGGKLLTPIDLVYGRK